VLGRGSYGVVHQVRHAKTGELAALKALRIGSGDPRAVRRFEREVEVLRRLDDPGIVRVLDSGVQDGVPWAALELVHGKTLADAPLSLPEWVAVLARVARAVGAVHRAGVAHRDLKPANVILASGSGAVKVIDFGLSFDSTIDESRLSRPGEVQGTPAYLAPEVVRGDASPDDPRRDVYALGIMLHERLAGENPFAVGSGHMGLVMERILRGPPILARRTGLDATLARIADKACATDLASRYPDGDALASELETWLGGGARETPVRGRRRLLVAGGLILVALAAVVFALGRGGGDRAAPLAPPNAALVSSRTGDGSSSGSGPLAVPGREVEDLIALLEAHFERGGLEGMVLARCRSFVSRSPRDPAARFVDVLTRALEEGTEFEARRDLVRLLREGAVPPRALGVTCRIFCTLGFDRAACCVGDEALAGGAVRPPSFRAEEMRVRIVSEPPVAWAARAEALAQGLLAEGKEGDLSANPPRWYLRVALSNARIARGDFDGAASALDLAMAEAPLETSKQLENESKALRQRLVERVLVGRHFASRFATTRFVAGVCYHEERAIETEPGDHPEALVALATEAANASLPEHAALARVRAARFFRETQRPLVLRDVLERSLRDALPIDTRALVLRSLARSLVLDEPPILERAEALALEAARGVEGFDPRAPGERVDAWALVARARLARGNVAGAREAIARARELAPRDARELDELEARLGK
jgi:hypothetical protein